MGKLVGVGIALLCLAPARPCSADDSRAREVYPESEAHEVSPDANVDPAPERPLSLVFEQFQGRSPQSIDADLLLDDAQVLASAAEEYLSPYAAQLGLDHSAYGGPLLLAERLLDSRGQLAELAKALGIDPTPLSAEELAEQAQSPPDSPRPDSPRLGGASSYMAAEVGGLLKRIDASLYELGVDESQRFSSYNFGNDLYEAVFGEPTKVGRLKEENEARWIFDEEPLEPGEYEWEYSGSIGYNSGKGNFSQEDQRNFELRQRLKTPAKHEYDFYQRYDVDHSYVDSTSLAIGAGQKLPNFLWDGKLRLKEEFRLYRDISNSLNNRQDGLFQLDFDPQWSDGRWRADLSYKYNIKEYETFSPRSSRQNRGKAKLTRQFSTDLAGSIMASIDRYQYSLGSNRGNIKTEFGTDWQWQINDQLQLSLNAEHEEKTYDVRKSRSYEQNRIDSGLRWRPDKDTNINLGLAVTDYDAPFKPERNYEDQDLNFSAQRTFSPRWSGDFNFTTRSQNFDVDPLDNLEQQQYGGNLSYTPQRDWSFYLRLDQASYEYGDPQRAYDSANMNLGANYNHNDFNAGASISRSENMYVADPLRDYENLRYSLDAGYRWGRHNLSGYWNRSSLDQADPASTNGYSEDALGGRWQFQLDEDVDLEFSYDRSLRDYQVGDNLKDTRFGARLEFEL